jgi:hypothetical protein
VATQVKRFSWVRSATGWEQFQSWQERRRAMREAFDTANYVANNGFGAAWANQISGASELAARAAQGRVATEINAKIDKLV